MFSQVRQGDLRVLPKDKQNKSSNKVEILPSHFNATLSVSAGFRARADSLHCAQGT